VSRHPPRAAPTRIGRGREHAVRPARLRLGGGLTAPHIRAGNAFMGVVGTVPGVSGDLTGPRSTTPQAAPSSGDLCTFSTGNRPMSS
jgi:hypothetical protein